MFATGIYHYFFEEIVALSDWSDLAESVHTFFLGTTVHLTRLLLFLRAPPIILHGPAFAKL
jgi:hypothetical protein